ncbi:MAG: hypothetical protein R2778_01335 [Saprospiraceae bacterium]
MKDYQPQRRDETESWLRSKLGDSFQPDAPEDAWQRLEHHLPQKQEPRRAVFWWPFALCTSTLILLFGICRDYGIIDSATTGEINNSVRRFKHSNEKPHVSVERDIDNSRNAFSADKSSHPLKNKSLTPAKPFVNNVSEQNPDQATPSESVNQVYRSQIVSNQIDTRSSLESITYSDQLAQLPFLSGHDIHFEDKSKDNPVLNIIPVSTKSQQIRRKKFRVRVEAAPIIFFPKKLEFSNPIPALLESSNSGYNGWQAGITLAIEPIRNWRIELGGQHFQQTHEAQHRPTLSLNDGVCLNPNDPGLKEYEFQYALVSSGNAPGNLTLRLQQEHAGSMMPKDEPFELDMKIRHIVSAWRIPLSIERHFDHQLGNAL